MPSVNEPLIQASAFALLWAQCTVNLAKFDIDIKCEQTLITARKRTCGKVMFISTGMYCENSFQHMKHF